MSKELKGLIEAGAQGGMIHCDRDHTVIELKSLLPEVMEYPELIGRHSQPNHPTLSEAKRIAKRIINGSDDKIIYSYDVECLVDAYNILCYSK